MSWGSTNSRVVFVPLRQWSEGGFTEHSPPQTPVCCDFEGKQVLLGKTAVAYGIAGLLQQTRSLCYSALSQTSLDEQCDINNFIVRIKSPSQGSQPTWRDIEGVDMLRPRLSVNIVEPSYLMGDDGDGQESELGGYLEAEFPSLKKKADGAADFVDQIEEGNRCHLFGVLLFELFSRSFPLLARDSRGIRFRDNESETEFASEDAGSSREPAHKKTQLVDLRAPSVLHIAGREKTHEIFHSNLNLTLLDRLASPSLSLVIRNLLDCGEDDRPDNAYECLEVVISDLHLLLLDPSRFLFYSAPIYDELGVPQLSLREYRLYGRENEVALITDAFCRVSSGTSESFFIGGFSGSGKSRLVSGLMTIVSMVGGYMLGHKFDQMSNEKPLLRIIALFNDLCLLVRDKNSQQDLFVIVNDLVHVFGSDLSVLARLLPNIKVFSPQLIPTGDELESENQINLRGICFMLQRFIKIVSSRKNPVVLFLDDVQWCDTSALAVVESLFGDVNGSTSLLLICTYRSNEVAEGHDIFCIAERLKSSGVPTTMVKLEGLNPKDLNTMISDALCMLPRISEPLSDIVFQKTKGNPFFALAFLRSLVDRGLLKHSTSMRTWFWDDDDVSSMDITDNVLHLLSRKLSRLSTKNQSALKVAACFGIKISAPVVSALSTNPDHSDIHNNLEQVVKEGLMIKVGSEFKFVHDKVREAAYSLIPEKDKNQYHYSLGMLLYSTAKGEVVDDILFSIADQIKQGIGFLADENPELQIDIAKIYELASIKAVVCSDFVSSCSYLTHALSILPTDHWRSHYDLSRRFSIRLAKSHLSCGDVEKAHCCLQDMIEQCHSFEDKLPAHALIATIHTSSKNFKEAYYLCCEVLSQLGEGIPQYFYVNQVTKMVQKTSKLLHNISDRDLLAMKEMNGKLTPTMTFFSLITSAAFFAKPEIIPFVACRMVQLTMKNGLCKYSIVGFIQLATALGSMKIAKSAAKKNIEDASRIGKAAMSCYQNRYNTSDQLPQLHAVYYGFFAWHTESLQTCADMLRRGFDAGMSLGQTNNAIFNSVHYVKTAIIAGQKLPTLLVAVDCFLKLANKHQRDIPKVYLMINHCTISKLINKREMSSPTSYDPPSVMANEHILQIMYANRALHAFWQGHSERCQHYIKKFLAVVSDERRIDRITISFIYGLNSFQLLRMRPKTKHRAIMRQSIQVLKSAAELSSWNFQNKVELLEAEEFSHDGNHNKAMASYLAAINSAQSSSFIHEQGLACELAGYHCKNVGDRDAAWSFFDQAKRCYTEWGSELKIDSVALQLKSLSDFIPVKGDNTHEISRQSSS
ncbi:hypothetical protein ACHAXA_010851 [Cyclostephanos tholiformis]|uniref:Orc1-like AAA ATPase domain-containing protein n=1 Tax=Cyclostephanos tholiformis TaxID=382380 RepID=A0ABD3SDI2_9STRA